MSHLNYGTQQAVMAAFRYFNLLDSNDTPTGRLEALTSAPDSERPKIYAAMLRDGYPYLFQPPFDLTRATSLQLEEAITDSGGTKGSTTEKAVAFFTAAAEAAGIQLSHQLTKRKTGGGNGGKRSKPRKARAKAVEQDVPPPPPPPPGREQSGGMYNQLLEKFPQLDPSWPDEIKAKWFSSFERLMKAVDHKETK